MSLAIEFNLDTDEMESKIEEIDSGWSGHKQAMMVAGSEKIVGRLKDNAPTNTGRLKGTIRAVDNGDRYNILAGGEEGVDYTLPVLEGSEPHPPGSSDPDSNRSLSRWARRNNYPGGFESIYWSIYWYGTEANDFVTPALDGAEDEVTGVMTQVLRNRGVIS